MKFHRFYIAPDVAKISQKFAIDDSNLFHQLKNVLRFSVGTEVVLFDGSGFEYRSVISEMARGRVGFVVDEKKKGAEVARKLTLVQAFIKRDRLEWLVEKVTELGVDEIVLFQAERSIKKFGNDSRLQKILIEASEQSGRVSIPRLTYCKSLEEVLVRFPQAILLHVQGEKFVTPLDSQNELSVIVGPEGGWTEGEIESAYQNGIKVECLGTTVLRAETAAVAVSSLALLNASVTR